ncbi:hypothetical protein ES703_20308 [subsurface metagenome]
MDFYRHPGDDVKVLPCCSLQFIFFTQEEDLHLPTISVNLPGDDKSIPPVVTSATEDYEFLILDAEFFQNDKIGSLAGFLHQRLLSDAKLACGLTVQISHFGYSAYSHFFPPIVDYTTTRYLWKQSCPTPHRSLSLEREETIIATSQATIERDFYSW